MKKFLSSTWFKCTSVLIIVAILSGGILAILNNVLYVSDAERAGRAIKKIYGEEKAYTVFYDVDDIETIANKPKDSSFGVIEKIFKVGTDTLFRAKGFNGYKGGTITVWVQVSYNDNTPNKIENVVLESFEKQTLMSKLGNDFYSKFTLTDITEEYKSGKIFIADPDEMTADKILNPVTNATKSANAGCNAINAVIEYVWGVK